MIVGLAGAHRSGKTTLAREFGKKNLDFTIAETSVSAIMASKGMDPSKDYDFIERLYMQHIILNELDKFYARFAENTVFDRTPLDAAAYLLADVQRQNVSPSVQADVCKYVEKAIDVTNRRFSMLLFVPPVLPLVDAPGKAPAQPAYVEHISQIISGLRHDQRINVKHFTLPREYLDIDVRVKALENARARTLSSHLAQLELMEDNGFSIH